MIHENNLVAVSHSDGNAYRSSEAAELTLNTAILRAAGAMKSSSRSLRDFTPTMSR